MATVSITTRVNKPGSQLIQIDGQVTPLLLECDGVRFWLDVDKTFAKGRIEVVLCADPGASKIVYSEAGLPGSISATLQKID